ncbi:MAG: hypothetical protein ACRDV4_00770 [Acidimicrobiales bacterium]
MSTSPLRPRRDRGPGACELCEAAKLTTWYHEDEICWVAECEICAVPMVVWRRHGTEPPEDDLDHMVAEITKIADAEFGEGGWSLDSVMRQIPDHFHAHARDPNWWQRRFTGTGSRAKGKPDPAG